MSSDNIGFAFYYNIYCGTTNRKQDNNVFSNTIAHNLYFDDYLRNLTAPYRKEIAKKLYVFRKIPIVNKLSSSNLKVFVINQCQ